MSLLNTLKFKIFSAKLILSLACLGTSFFFVSKLFITEKKADIFESGLLRSKLILSEYENKFKIASILYENHKPEKGVIGGIEGLEEVISCKNDLALTETYRTYEFELCPKSSSIRSAKGYFAATFYRNTTGVTYIFKLSQQNRAGLESGIASFSILDEKSKKLIYTNSDQHLYTEIESQGTKDINFTKEVEINGENYLAVSVKSIGLSWRTFMFYRSKVIFQAFHQLELKIISLALLITGIILIVSLILSNHLSAPIIKLTALAEAIKNGDFHQRFTGKVYGEFRLLGETFNSMADKIIFYLDEMKEKTRLESEVKVAQLVQASFFPESQYVDNEVQIHGFYQPASECGGDWWTFQYHNDKVYFALGDVTGHGVASSLITASVHSYATLWKRIFKEESEKSLEPAYVLEGFNEVLRGAGGNLNMTMFVGCYDKKLNKLTYANASHEQPFIISSSSKDDIKYLDGISGTRLGEEESPNYKQFEEILPKKSFLVLYSDGYTEGLNPEGKYWGEGRFLRELAKHYSSLKAEEMNNGINSGFIKFANSAEQADDLSLLTVYIK